MATGGTSERGGWGLVVGRISKAAVWLTASGLQVCSLTTCPSRPSNPCRREGYLFRDGSLGRGYYRKDVVRRYCASVGLDPPATPPPEAKGSGGRGAGKGQLGGEAARQYIQRLLAAPPSMHSVVADAAAGLLFTSSLGPSDCAVRVWRLWDACSGAGSDAARSSGESDGLLQPALVHTLSGHTAPVLSLALSPDRRLLFTGSHDYTVRVWRIADWHCLRVLKGHGGGVRVLAVAPDGATLYSAASDNTIRVRAGLPGMLKQAILGAVEQACNG